MSTPPMLVPCPDCHTQIPREAEFCPNCEANRRALSLRVTSDARERIAAVACYFTPLPALVLLKLKPYRDSAFIRFHAFQSLLVAAGVLILVVLGALFAHIGWTVFWLMFGLLFFVALFFLWLVLSIKAGQGIKFPLPYIGGLAEKHSAR